MNNRLNDTRHASGNITITRLLGCPRRSLIEDFLPYEFHPLNHNSPHVGTVVHGEMEKEVRNSPWQDGAGRAEVEVEGELFGIKVTGKIDWVAEDATLICDYKFHGDKSMAWKASKQEWVDDTLVAQLNMQRLLLEQDWNLKSKVARLEVWHGAMTALGGQPWHRVDIPLRDEEWIAQVRPLRGGFTVGQIAAFYKQTLDMMGQMVTVSEEGQRGVIKTHCPAIGKTQMPGKNGCMACNYCPTGVKAICDKMEATGGW